MVPGDDDIMRTLKESVDETQVLSIVLRPGKPPEVVADDRMSDDAAIGTMFRGIFSLLFDEYMDHILDERDEGEEDRR